MANICNILPLDIFDELFTFVDPNTLIHLRIINKHFKLLIDIFLDRHSDYSKFIAKIADDNIFYVLGCCHRLHFENKLYSNMITLTYINKFCELVGNTKINNFLNFNFKLINDIADEHGITLHDEYENYDVNVFELGEKLMKWIFENNYEVLMKKISLDKTIICCEQMFTHNKPWILKYPKIKINYETNFRLNNKNSIVQTTAKKITLNTILHELEQNIFRDNEQYEYYKNTSKHILRIHEYAFRNVEISVENMFGIIKNINMIDDLEYVKTILFDTKISNHKINQINNKHDAVKYNIFTDLIKNTNIIFETIHLNHCVYLTDDYYKDKAKIIVDHGFFGLYLCLIHGYFDFKTFHFLMTDYNKKITPYEIIQTISKCYNQEQIISLLISTTSVVYPLRGTPSLRDLDDRRGSSICYLTEKYKNYYIPKHTSNNTEKEIDLILLCIHNTDNIPVAFNIFLLHLKFYDTFIKIIKKRKTSFTQNDTLLIRSLVNKNHEETMKIINTSLPKLTYAHIFGKTDDTHFSKHKWNPEFSGLDYTVFNNLNL